MLCVEVTMIWFSYNLEKKVQKSKEDVIIENEVYAWNDRTL